MGGPRSRPTSSRGLGSENEPARDVSRGRGASPHGLCQVWGVLNVTPDSFSDGGAYLDPSRAVERAKALIAEGADVIDVGGESSRPPGATYGEGAAKVSVEEELARVIGVVERVRGLGARVSIDTVKPEVAAAALRAGASIVNDVSCGASAALIEVVAEAGAELVLMHTRAGGRVDESTRYDDVLAEVLSELGASVERARAMGIPGSRIWIDPGIGFAKTAEQSTILLGNLDALVRTGYPVLVGASRKSFIARTAIAAGSPEPAPGDRLGGSLAALTAAVMNGARAVRVHDVFESVQAVRIAEAIRGRRRESQ
jgi:dihydropteroate synthase